MSPLPDGLRSLNEAKVYKHNMTSKVLSPSACVTTLHLREGFMTL